MAKARRTALQRAGRLALVIALGPAAALAAPPTGAALTTWLSEKTDLSPSQIVLVAPEHVYSLERLGPPLATGEVIALVRTEAYDDAWSAAHGFQSWEAHFLFDCHAGRLRAIRSATYPQRNRKGSPTPATQREDWLTPPADQAAAQLLAAACDPAFAWPLRPTLQAVTPAPALPAAIPTTAPPDADKPPVVVAARPEPPTTAPKPTFSVQVGRGPSEEGAKRALEKATRTLGPPAQSLTASSEMDKAGGRVRYIARLDGFPTAVAATEACSRLIGAGQDCFTRGMTAMPSEPPIAHAEGLEPQSSEPAAAAAADSGYLVQVARGPSEADAKKILEKARLALGPAAGGLTSTVETAQLGRRRRYTALISGFATEAAAAEACAKLRSSGQSCYTRRGKPAAAGAAR